MKALRSRAIDLTKKTKQGLKEETRDNKVETSGVCCADRDVRHTVFLFPDVPKDERSHADGPQKHLSIN